MQYQNLLCSSRCPLASSSGVGRRLAGTQAGQLTQTDQRDIPCHMTSYSPINPGGGSFSKAAFVWSLTVQQSAGGRCSGTTGRPCHTFPVGL